MTRLQCSRFLEAVSKDGVPRAVAGPQLPGDRVWVTLVTGGGAWNPRMVLMEYIKRINEAKQAAVLESCIYSLSCKGLSGALLKIIEHFL